MIVKLLKIIKKLILASLLIYGYNVLAIPLDIVIPINVITVLIVVFFDFSGLMGLILFKILL